MRDDRWAATLGLIDRFWPPLRAADAVPDGRIDEAGARLRIPVPVTLREWYRLAGGRGDFLGNQDRLLPPEEWEVSGGALVFAREGCGSLEWGVRRTDLRREDPPVVEADADLVLPRLAGGLRAALRLPGGGRVRAASVSIFFAWMVHEGLFLAAPFNNGAARCGGGRASCSAPNEVLAAVRAHYPPLPGASTPGAQVYGDGDTLVRVTRGPGRRGLYVAARTVAAAERLVALTGFPADELQHQGRYWFHRFGPPCRDVGPGYILRQPFPSGMAVDEDALLQPPPCHGQADGPRAQVEEG